MELAGDRDRKGCVAKLDLLLRAVIGLGEIGIAHQIESGIGEQGLVPPLGNDQSAPRRALHDPATGRRIQPPLISMRATRDKFDELVMMGQRDATPVLRSWLASGALESLGTQKR